MARRPRTQSASLDFAFFQFLWEFYRGNRGTIRTHYKELTRKFLDFNNPEKNPKAFLREPQFEALEMYVFLKEFMGNAKVEEIFKAWFEKSGRFADRAEGGIVGDTRQGSMFDAVTQDQYKAVFAAMRKNSRIYPNYIFALTMGTGKTILMATCIFYEFLLGNKFEKDKRFCHNALVFAPDKKLSTQVTCSSQTTISRSSTTSFNRTSASAPTNFKTWQATRNEFKSAWLKGDHQIEDSVVQAKKDFAQQIAVASGMEYRIIKSSDADER